MQVACGGVPSLRFLLTTISVVQDFPESPAAQAAAPETPPPAKRPRRLALSESLDSVANVANCTSPKSAVQCSCSTCTESCFLTGLQVKPASCTSSAPAPMAQEDEDPPPGVVDHTGVALHMAWLV